jgi:hypothetical protein
MKLRSAKTLAHGSLLALAIAAVACSPARKGQAGDDIGSRGGQGGSAGGDMGGDSAGAGQGGSAGSDLGLGGNDTGTTTGFQSCAKATQAPATLPLDIYIAIDKSGSMLDNNKWGNVKNAFFNFFNSPDNQSSKISASLRFWPDGNCNTDTCDVNGCAQPQVPLGPLSDAAHVQALENLYNSKSPGGNTPMFPALAGAAKWTEANAAQGEGAKATVIVFVTDGQPHGCDENINDIAANAADAYKKAKVETFAVGLVGSNESDMTAIAVAGNTQKPFLIGNGNAEAELSAALKEIQKTTLACVFAMPEASGPDPIDPSLVNLTYTPGGGKSETIGQVKSKADCDAAGGQGWYYDDPAKPKIIQLCPGLCSEVQKDDAGKIEVVLGCASQPA